MESLTARNRILEEEREQLLTQNRELMDAKESAENGCQSLEEENRRLMDEKRHLDSVIVRKDQELGRMLTQEINNEVIGML